MLVDDDFVDAGIETDQNIFQQVVGHRAGRNDFFDFQGDRIGFVNANPDGEDVASAASFRITMGMLVIGSIIRPRIFISTSTGYSSWFTTAMYILSAQNARRQWRFACGST